MPLIDTIIDSVISETGATFPVTTIKNKIIDASRDFCMFSLIMNKSVQVIAEATTADASKNYAQSFVVAPYTDTEPCGIFGLTVNGHKLASAERDAVSPSGASTPIYNTGGIYYKFSSPTTCLIHPLQSGGDVRFFAAFMPTPTASQIDDAFWSLYGNDILYGVKAALFMMAGYRSTALDVAMAMGAEFNRLKRKARAEVNNTIIGESLCC